MTYRSLVLSHRYHDAQITYKRSYKVNIHSFIYLCRNEECHAGTQQADGSDHTTSVDISNDIPNLNGCCETPVDAPSSPPQPFTIPDDDSDFLMVGVISDSHKSRHGKREGTKKSSDRNNKKKTNQRKSRPTSPDPNTCTISEPCCYVGCVLNGKPSSDMIRCSLCMTWIHISCSGEKTAYVGAWTCMHCRRVPLLLSELKCEVINLSLRLETVHRNEDALKDEIQKLKSENSTLKQKFGILKSNNDDVEETIETTSDITNVKQNIVDAYLNRCEVMWNSVRIMLWILIKSRYYGDSHQRHQKWSVTILSKLECELYLIWKNERKDGYLPV